MTKKFILFTVRVDACESWLIWSYIKNWIPKLNFITKNKIWFSIASGSLKLLFTLLRAIGVIALKKSGKQQPMQTKFLFVNITEYESWLGCEVYCWNNRIKVWLNTLFVAVMGLIYLPIIFLMATSWLFIVTSVLIPDSQASHNLKAIYTLIKYYINLTWPNYYCVIYFQEILKFPSTLDELKLITSSLLEFQQYHPFYVFVLFSSAYIYKQAFAIPGSVFLVCFKTIILKLYFLKKIVFSYIV